MRTITTEHKLYKLDELSEEARAKAIEDRRQHEWEWGMEWLEDDVRYKLEELFEEHGITDVDTTLHYSLGYSQGDGASFTGDIEWKAWRASITKNHWGTHYQHWNSVHIDEMTSLKTDKDAPEDTQDKLLAIVHDIGKELERYGYDCIETYTSDENIKELLQDDEFYEDGTRY